MGMVVGMEEVKLLKGCPYTSTVSLSSSVMLLPNFTPFHSLQKGVSDPEYSELVSPNH